MKKVNKGFAETYFPNQELRRPSLPSRYQLRQDILEGIQLAHALHRDNPNEKSKRLIEILESALTSEDANETIFREDEIREILGNPGLFPRAVVSWVIYYRDSEMQ